MLLLRKTRVSTYKLRILRTNLDISAQFSSNAFTENQVSVSVVALQSPKH